MMERRIGIWAAILFLVIASRGCSGGGTGDPTSDAAGEARQELVRSVVYDPRKAVEKYWWEGSWSSYYISLETIKLAQGYMRKTDFQQDLLKFDYGALKDEMEKAKTNVLSSSNECLVVEANQDSHEPHFNFLYQLILIGDAGSPKVREAFILGGWKREVSQHRVILDQLIRTIENPMELSDILTDDYPLLALQVLDVKGCEPHSGRTRARVNEIYEDKFLSLFGESYELEVAEEFEGDKHIQFKGDIWSTSGEPICDFLMAATVVGEGFDKRVKSIHIIVEKEVAENPGKTTADQLSAEASQIDETSGAVGKRKTRDDTDKADRPSKISKLVKKLRDLVLCTKRRTETDMDSSENAVMDTSEG